jgi:ubiquitin fusion degradation protein 1
MVDLPHDFLEKLNKKKIDPPYFFQITTQSKLKSFVGVRQFTSQKDTIEIPLWLSNQLGIFGNQIINVKLIQNIPKGKFIRIRPESEDFFDIPEYESCLETKLSLFPLLYQGMSIEISIMDKKYEIYVEDVDMDWENFDFSKDTDTLEMNVINVINSDVNVDIKNKFLEKKLKEEARQKELELERQKELAKQRELEIAKQLELAKQKELVKSNTPFVGEGRTLNDGNTTTVPERSIEDIRLARLAHFKKLQKKQEGNKNKEDNKNKEPLKEDKDVIV